MQIYGQSEFYVFANPVVSSDNSSVLYDGFVAFMDGDTLYKFMLVDGIAYFTNSSLTDSSTSSTTECLTSSMLPPLNSIVSALNDATAISSVSTSDDPIDCSSGNLFKLSFGEAAFALCASGTSGFAVYGSDLDIAVEYLDSPVEISAPELNTNAALECETVATASSMTSATLALLTGESIASTGRRKLEAEPNVTLASSSCSCQSTPRPCIFIHGLGITAEESENQDSLSGYWGDITAHAPCCTSIKYAVLDTMDYGWTDETLQHKVCDHALSVSSSSSSSTGIIADTIIVSHSMGGLMLAGALATGKCRLASSTSWVSLSAPMTGSMGSDYLQGSCNGQTNVFLEVVANLIGQCPANSAIRSLAYENESYSSSELNAAYEAAQTAYRTYVTAAMCSNDYSGLFSALQAVYKLGGFVIPHKSSENDGVVEFQSCAGGLTASKFGDSYQDQFYVTRLNHADTAFLNGDALFQNSQKPVKWFECLL
ncbi:hypothetical protein BBJ28_00007970 [Nothophytophthora sp. Chile5]|nr:hypothetical protein BBJ28_00007970 [Nothophytophthora sp. Chile5]